MHSKLQHVQIVVSLLKQRGIKNLVLCPGNRDVPLVHTVEDDSDFHCFSIVDERSAAFFALGLAEATGEPAAFACTSSTASCNFLPAIKEAAERHIPLIALTADRENYFLYQFEDQKIDQTNMYAPYTKVCADLPVIRNPYDKWLCERKTNEALLALTSGVPGPVQINIQIHRTDQYEPGEGAAARRIDRIDEAGLAAAVPAIREKLAGKRILVLAGELYGDNEELSRQLSKFQSKFDAAVLANHFSNLSGPFLQSSPVADTITPEELSQSAPGIVITLGGHYWPTITTKLRNAAFEYEHWHLGERYILQDGFKRLTTQLAMPPAVFFRAVCEGMPDTEGNYLPLWQAKARNIKYPDLGFSNFAVIKQVTERIPAGSTVHTGILNGARLNDFCEYKSADVRTYCNFGAYGIDGCFSSLLGQSEGLSFMISGDLSFLYDLNMSRENIGNNVRILVVNNHAGSEFYYHFGARWPDTVGDYIAAGHRTDIRSALAEDSFEYLSAGNQAELDKALDAFFGDSPKPVLLEVFTDARQDGALLRSFYDMNAHRPEGKNLLVRAKRMMRSLLKR